MYIPAIYCAKCNKELSFGTSQVTRVHQDLSPTGAHRFIRVRCHGEEAEVDFAETAGERVILWQSQSGQES